MPVGDSDEAERSAVRGIRLSHLSYGRRGTPPIVPFEHRLKNWLAIDDSVYGAHDLSTDFLALEPHLVLLDSRRGIGDAQAQQRIRDWLGRSGDIEAVEVRHLDPDLFGSVEVFYAPKEVPQGG